MSRKTKFIDSYIKHYIDRHMTYNKKQLFSSFYMLEEFVAHSFVHMCSFY